MYHYNFPHSPSLYSSLTSPEHMYNLSPPLPSLPFYYQLISCTPPPSALTDQLTAYLNWAL